MPAIDFPSSPVQGQVFGNYAYDAVVGVWRASTQATPGLPAGTIVQWPTNTPPANWTICDGSALSRTTYASLFAAIGTTYGSGDGTTTFNIPNLKGRVGVGRDASQTEFDTLGETGGAKTHTLTTSEMPIHSHGITDPGHGHSINDPGHTHAALGDASDGSAVLGLDAAAASKNGSYGGLIAAAATGITINGSGTGISINNAGSDGAHNNLQPYVVLNYIIKTSAGASLGDSELASRLGVVEQNPNITGTLTVAGTATFNGNVFNPNRPMFRATNHNGSTTTGVAKMSWNGVSYNVGNNWSSANNRFTAPVAGYYFFAWTTLQGNTSPHSNQLRKNGLDDSGSNTPVGYPYSNYMYTNAACSTTVYLAVNDYVELWILGGVAHSHHNYITGYLLG